MCNLRSKLHSLEQPMDCGMHAYAEVIVIDASNPEETIDSSVTATHTKQRMQFIPTA
jgi:hypothetical protein